ncbi:MAG: hypothetical protein ACOZCO_02545 [Bacteroidota bacterium]
MRKLLLSFLCLPLLSTAQNNTFIEKEKVNITEDTLPQRGKTILVIPFEPKMYMSQIDKEVGAYNGLTFEQVNEKMRQNLVESVAFRTDETLDSYCLYSTRIDSIKKELHYVYSSVEYVYEPLPAEPKEKTTEDKTKTKEENKKPFGKITLKREPQNAENKTQTPDPGTRIENGQIVSSEDNREKFMDVTVLNKNLFNELNKYYNADHFLFINQLDIIFSSESTRQVRIKVHYSFFDLNGKKLSSGAVTGMMPVGIYDLSKIRNDYFYPLAIQMNEKIKTSLGLMVKN